MWLVKELEKKSLKQIRFIKYNKKQLSIKSIEFADYECYLYGGRNPPYIPGDVSDTRFTNGATLYSRQVNIVFFGNYLYLSLPRVPP